jgi:hypothetical protein
VTYALPGIPLPFARKLHRRGSLSLVFQALTRWVAPAVWLDSVHVYPPAEFCRDLKFEIVGRSVYRRGGVNLLVIRPKLPFGVMQTHFER